MGRRYCRTITTSAKILQERYRFTLLYILMMSLPLSCCVLVCVIDLENWYIFLFYIFSFKWHHRTGKVIALHQPLLVDHMKQTKRLTTNKHTKKLPPLLPTIYHHWTLICLHVENVLFFRAFCHRSWFFNVLAMRINLVDRTVAGTLPNRITVATVFSYTSCWVSTRSLMWCQVENNESHNNYHKTTTETKKLRVK